MTKYRGFTKEDLRSSYEEYRVRCAAEGEEPLPEWEWKSNSDVLHFVEKLGAGGWIPQGGRKVTDCTECDVDALESGSYEEYLLRRSANGGRPLAEKEWLSDGWQIRRALRRMEL